MVPVNFAFIEFLTHRFGKDKNASLEGHAPVEHISEGGEA
jgi:hypothetical protein